MLRARSDTDMVSAHTSLDWARHALLTRQADVLVTHLGPLVSGSLALLEKLTPVDPRPKSW